MNDKTKALITIFLGVCLMGLIVALAGGVEWGTRDAGFMTLITLVLAIAGCGIYFDINE